jgi:hypothetical protein
MVSFPLVGKAEVVDLFANVQKIPAGFLAHKAKANTRLGPSAPDGRGDAEMVGGQAPGGPSVPQEFIEALPCPGSVFPTDPQQIGSHCLADGSASTCIASARTKC